MLNSFSFSDGAKTHLAELTKQVKEVQGKQKGSRSRLNCVSDMCFGLLTCFGYDRRKG